MRCPHCGQILNDGLTTCTRCQGDLSPASRRKDVLVSLAVAIVGIVIIAILAYVVLNWHEMQLLSG